jgi:hypothetical protein
LKISHHGLSHTFDFAPKSDETYQAQWAAFYRFISFHFLLIFSLTLFLKFFFYFCSDCVHEVKPVTIGTRITVTYLLEELEEEAENYNYFDAQKKTHSAKSFFCGPADATMSVAKIDGLVAHLDSM